jgi:hypothetical protein
VREFSSDIAFTPGGEDGPRRGARASCVRMERDRGWRTTVSPDLTAFLADLEMFYLQRPRQVSVFVPRENPSYGDISSTARA